jgi:hypothetical protein
MARNYRSAQGKTVDMAALAAKNERVRAVGNMKVNARGDTIDSKGRIIKPVTQKVGDSYSQTVGNKSANVVKKPVSREVPPKPKKVEVKEEITLEEKELESDLDFDLEVEAIKKGKSN